MNASTWIVLGCLINVATFQQLHHLFAYHNQFHDQRRRDESEGNLPPRLDYGAKSDGRAKAFCFLEEGDDAEVATHCGTD